VHRKNGEKLPFLNSTIIPAGCLTRPYIRRGEESMASDKSFYKYLYFIRLTNESGQLKNWKSRGVRKIYGRKILKTGREWSETVASIFFAPAGTNKILTVFMK